jgi:hypothetical protein
VLLGLSVNALSVRYLPNEGTPPPAQQRASLTFDSKSNILYFYGGISIEYQSNILRFDLNARKWTQLNNSSWISPGQRYNGFITIREESGEIILFGGISDNGPTLGVWNYKKVDEAVKST